MVLEQAYIQARRMFLQFKTGLEEDKDVLDELLAAFELLITERSTTYYENRFIAGGAAEHIIAAAMRCVGLTDVRTVGFEDTRVDVVVDGQGLSVKSVFTVNGTIALINVRGGGVEWAAPTILLLCNGLSRGIGYVDPGLLPPNSTKQTRDQITLPRTPINILFRERPEYLLRCAIPANRRPPDDVSQIPTAISEVVAQDILLRTETGKSLLSPEFIEEFFQGTASDPKIFPRLSQCMEEANDAG